MYDDILKVTSLENVRTDKIIILKKKEKKHVGISSQQRFMDRIYTRYPNSSGILKT